MDEPPFPHSVAESVREGDPDALAMVVRVLAGPLNGWLRAQGVDVHTAEDLVEETFLDLVRSCRRLQPDAFAQRAWLYTATRNNLIDHRRRQARRPEQLTDEMPERAGAEPGPEALAEQDDDRRRLLVALEALTDDQRAVVTLRFLADLPAGEVARIVGKRERAVRTMQHRAVAALARAVGDVGLGEEMT